MKVKEIMCANPIYISPDTTLREAAKKMREKDIGFLPIGKDDRLVGAVTDRDITIKAVSQGNGIADMPVKDVMTEHIKYCFEDDTVEEAAKTMCDLQLHRLVVLNKNKRLTGILALKDLAKNNDDKLCGRVVHEITA
jgi:CBS domain-containing protein